MSVYSTRDEAQERVDERNRALKAEGFYYKVDVVPVVREGYEDTYMFAVGFRSLR